MITGARQVLVSVPFTIELNNPINDPPCPSLDVKREIRVCVLFVVLSLFSKIFVEGEYVFVPV
jgi:hypothetical protein